MIYVYDSKKGRTAFNISLRLERTNMSIRWKFPVSTIIRNWMTTKSKIRKSERYKGK